VPWETLLQRLFAARPVRRVADSLYRSRARRRVVELDHLSPARSQVRTLLGLTYQARTTRFGRDHDFPRIRTVQDFQRLVPLRTPLQLGKEYWASAEHSLDHTTWPRLPFRALADAPGDCFSSAPLSAETLSGFGSAALTALGFIVQARPHARLLQGHVVVLGKEPWGGGGMPEPGITAGSLERIVTGRLPGLLRSGVLGPLDPDREEAHRLQALFMGPARLPVTTLVGSASHLTRFFSRLQALSGWDRLVDGWPELTAVLYPGDSAVPDLDRLTDSPGGEEVLALEVWLRPEGVLAIEDPRYRLLRLLPDQGIFFEFIPASQLGQPGAARHTLADVEPGLPYVAALSSASGVWACVTDARVLFERREPPLVRLLAAPLPGPTPLAHVASPSPSPHLRTASPDLLRDSIHKPATIR
jgi:hypothetical protein